MAKQSTDVWDGKTIADEGKNEMDGLGFASWANLIPAYVDRNWNTTTGTQNPKIQVSPGSMLCRGTVMKIIAMEIWGMDPEDRNLFLDVNFPEKLSNALESIVVELQNDSDRLSLVSIISAIGSHFKLVSQKRLFISHFHE